MERKRKRKYGFLVLGLAAVMIIAAGLILHTQKPYVPPDKTDRTELSRSQVYLNGKGYVIDSRQAKAHDKTEKARAKKLAEEQQKRQDEQKKTQEDDSVPVKDVKNTNREPGDSGTPGGKTEDPDAPEADDPEDVRNRERDSEAEKNLTEDEKAELPSITTSLISGDEINGKSGKFWVTATDSKGRNIPVYSVGDGSFTVTCNGATIRSTGAAGTRTYFRTVLQDGKNTFKITAVDRNGKKRTVTRWITCDTGKKAEATGTVTVTVSASVIGLGTLMSRKVDITDGESVEELLKTALNEGGYNYVISRGYLAAIGKPGIANGWKISEAARAKLREERATEKDPDKQSKDRIREKDFYSTSGWMYSVNGERPGVGIGSCVPEDGDEIRVFFALSQNVY
ncbi:DUF4430 domain-containing protein [Hornefia butyriciproducens]|uniref:DUF4430 domain-containing protein n=1 Tax=Hornefia butyriciproducens TaxID=2652293 RepID=UPI002A74FFE3|nr:DUF4430 domain-containing protein [Hornefia butyriciproducens]MDY2990939.1 DUF4430 domain-containing protein [Hornefia butyriciproducens]